MNKKQVCAKCQFTMDYILGRYKCPSCGHRAIIVASDDTDSSSSEAVTHETLFASFLDD